MAMPCGKILEARIKNMRENPGIYLCGDIQRPEATIPITSMKGKLYSMLLDQELDTEGFLSTLTIEGPYTKRKA